MKMALDAFEDCTCDACTSSSTSIIGGLKKAVITAAILGPLGAALHFWFKKKRLSKHLTEVQSKFAVFYYNLHHDASRLRRICEENFPLSKSQDSKLRSYNLETAKLTMPTDDVIQRRYCDRFNISSETAACGDTDYIDIDGGAPLLLGDNVKRLEQAVDTLTRGMKITNKRLLQLSEQVLYLRKKLEKSQQFY